MFQKKIKNLVLSIAIFMLNGLSLANDEAKIVIDGKAYKVTVVKIDWKEISLEELLPKGLQSELFTSLYNRSHPYIDINEYGGFYYSDLDLIAKEPGKIYFGNFATGVKCFTYGANGKLLSLQEGRAWKVPCYVRGRDEKGNEHHLSCKPIEEINVGGKKQRSYSLALIKTDKNGNVIKKNENLRKVLKTVYTDLTGWEWTWYQHIVSFDKNNMYIDVDTEPIPKLMVINKNTLNIEKEIDYVGILKNLQKPLWDGKWVGRAEKSSSGVLTELDNAPYEIIGWEDLKAAFRAKGGEFPFLQGDGKEIEEPGFTFDKYGRIYFYRFLGEKPEGQRYTEVYILEPEKLIIPQ